MNRWRNAATMATFMLCAIATLGTTPAVTAFQLSHDRISNRNSAGTHFRSFENERQRRDLNSPRKPTSVFVDMECQGSTQLRMSSVDRMIARLRNSTDDVADDATANSLVESSATKNTIGGFLPVDSVQTSNQSMINTMLGLIFFVASLSALDRSSMSVALVPMSGEMGYTDTTKGEISSFFSLGYGLGIVPCGLLLPYLSPRAFMSIGVLLWSAGTIATPFAAAQSQMGYLLFCRALVGASESVVIPTVQKLYSNWIPAQKKSLSVAILFAGFQSGTILSYILSPYLLDMFHDWRSLFYIYGTMGLLYLVPWLMLAQDKPMPVPVAESRPTNVEINWLERAAATFDTKTTTSSRSSSGTRKNSAAIDAEVVTNNGSNNGDESLQDAMKDASKILSQAPWADFAKSKGVWAMVLAHAANNWGLYNNLSWAPTFYFEQYGLNVKESALLLIVPSLAGAAGGFFAGSVADTIIQNMEERTDEAVTNIRRAFQGLGLFGAAACLATLSLHIPDDPTTAQCLLSGSVAFQSFNAAGYGAANQEKAGEKWTGLLYSVTSLPAVMCGTFGVYTTGKILDMTHQDWSYVFGLNSIVFALGAAAFVGLYDSKREFD